jgi:hypothetical protein
MIMLVTATVWAGGLPVEAQQSSPTDAPKPSRQVVGQEATGDVSPVLAAVQKQFQTMSATRYQHMDQENAAAGTYFYDCVGMVTYTLRLAAPQATDALLTDLRIKPGYVPSPPHYVQWFTSLDTEPNPSWQEVSRVADVQPGDVLAWNLEANNPSSTVPGHSVIAAGPPLLLSDGSFALLVYDSTATPHGPFDSRRTDPRNETGPNGLPSGLGKGTIQLIPDATTGAPVSVAWTVGTAPTIAPIGIGRALQ